MPKHAYVDSSKPIVDEPPSISRVNKPVSPPKNVTVELPLKTEIHQVSAADADVITFVSVDNVESVPFGLQLDADIPDQISLANLSNPVPKPERGHYIPTSDEESFTTIEIPEKNVEVELAVETETEVDLHKQTKADLQIDLVSYSEGTVIGEPQTLSQNKELLLENSPLIQSVSDSIIISAVAEASTPEKENHQLEVLLETASDTPQSETVTDSNINKMDFSVIKPRPVDLDGLPERRVDHDSDDDQGQFHLVTEEIQEEQATPIDIKRRSRVMDGAKLVESESDRSSFFKAIASEPSVNSWLDAEWKRLDSKAKEEQAELIAEQVGRCFLKLK